MKPGDIVEIRQIDIYGEPQRSWKTTIESIDDECIVTFAPPGNIIDWPNGEQICDEGIRAFYWFEKSLNLLEIYGPDGELEKLYVNIASPIISSEDGQLEYTDYYLDIRYKPGSVPRLLDEDEFAAAAEALNLPFDFQAACYRAVAEAIDLISGWPTNDEQPDL